MPTVLDGKQLSIKVKNHEHSTLSCHSKEGQEPAKSAMLLLDEKLNI